MITDFVLLSLIWFGGWGLTFRLLKRGVSYIDNWVVLSLVFLAWSALLNLLFWPRVQPLTRGFSPSPILVLLGVLVATSLTYAFCRRFLSRPERLIRENPEEFYLQMSLRYLGVKLFEVLYQQSCIVVLTLLLAEAGLDLGGVLLAFIVIFGIVHLPLLVIIGKGFARYYGIASATLSLAFPILITQIHYGFVYSYAAHILFYTLSALFIWIWSNRRDVRAG